MNEINWEQLILYYHPIFLTHLQGINHPEKPDRLKIIQEYLKKKGVFEKIDIKESSSAELKWIETTHDKDYISSVQRACQSAPTTLDGGDTIVTETSYNSALFAAGACLNGIDDLFQNRSNAVFCAVRPPGHHAEHAHAMGFCLFNNVAIAANYAIQKYGLKKIFILDWDVHHGNGTQNTFKYSDQVYFCSLHESSLYPGTGYLSEIGENAGKGFNLNIPMKAHSTDSDYISVFNEKIIPEIKKFRPELLIISAGFDAHLDDPLASMRLSTSCYSEMTRFLTDEMANNGNKILSVLEGGYHLEHLAESVYVHLQELSRMNAV